MRTPLTKRQQEIFDFIADEIHQRGIPPTIREVGDRFGMRSSNGAREALNALARKGYIRRHDRLSRGIELVEPAPQKKSEARHQIPLIKRLPPGTPDIYQGTIVRYLTIDDHLVPNGRSPFAIIAGDDALEDSGLFAGDLVIAIASPRPADGDLVVVQIGSRLLVRRYRTTGATPSVESDQNGDSLIPVSAARDSAHLIGKVHCLIRTFGDLMVLS